MDRNPNPPYPEHEGVVPLPQEQSFGTPQYPHHAQTAQTNAYDPSFPPQELPHKYPPSNGTAVPVPQELHFGAPTYQEQPGATQASQANAYDPSFSQQGSSYKYSPSHDYQQPIQQNDSFGKQETSQRSRKLSKKWQRRLYWMVPLGIVAIVFAVLFEVYKSDFERWVTPLTDWLREREAWSWLIPTAILVILSFPPLFGHEIVQLIVGLTYPLGVAIGIACAGAVVGEAACFIVFKYWFTDYVEKKIAAKIRWAAVARVTQEAGFRGVLVIRYSIVPPHLANPLFSCTGMKFWVYMATVVLSLPKSMVFVALGSPASEHSKAGKWGKVVAIGVVVIITVFASMWIRKKMAAATKAIEAERNITHGGDEEYEMLSPPGRADDTSYRGISTTGPGDEIGTAR